MSAEGARRQPNLSGKRTEGFPFPKRESAYVCFLWSCCFVQQLFFVWLKDFRGERKKNGHHSQHRAENQLLPVRLHPDRAADRHRPAVHHQDPLCAGPLLRRRDAGGLQEVQHERRQEPQRPQLLPGADYRHRRPGGHRQHCRRLRRHPHRWPRRHLLDVDHRLLRHGHHLCRGSAGPGDP